MHISSHFQPIVSLAHRRAVGYEALLRATLNNEPCSPVLAFDQAWQHGCITQFDRRCLLNHLAEFSGLLTAEPLANQWVFLNVHSQSIQAKNHRADLLIAHLATLGLTPDNVAIEILEQGVKDCAQLKAFVAHYREAGFLIAMDDFGSGYSNFDRVWELKPHIVKLDKSMLHNARAHVGRQRWLARCIALLRETGALIVLEGVETAQDVLIALDVEADLVQGYYFARPSAQGVYDQAWLFSQLHELHHQAVSQQQVRQAELSSKKQALKQLVRQSSQALTEGWILRPPCAHYCNTVRSSGCTCWTVRGCKWLKVWCPNTHKPRGVMRR